MSAVWRYYKVDDNNIAIANCEICKLGIARGGKEKATFNTTNLIRHLKNKHPTQYSEFTQATQPKTSQLTLQESLKRREKMPRDSAKAQDITAKIAQMIAMSDLPFAFVENPGFLMLMEHVEPRFEMPSATAADVIPAITVLRRVLSREDDDDQGIKTMKRTLLEAVEKRFADVETEPLF
ncbi:zinc finger BED domain-containing protein 1-like isoform X2 [Sinocyclocheilus rhinocerous]|uniref:zinc finger BED domain-containing protein 1-like isoform X2 n=1 Tax=Sinocyclocheilus rhinocerous TaxID=307959 RepID=UPI0007B84584|nr:PREDICTED: zinc finger BED domain-containing protein 1-like isoform X2 [Sinocyclocheilus rhinocerous]